MTKDPAVRPHPARLLMRIRSIHTWTGLLIAPATVFFSLTGLVQIYSLHEAHPGYTPPAIIEKLGMVHKNQRFAAGRRKGAGPNKEAGRAAEGGAPGARGQGGAHDGERSAPASSAAASGPSGPPGGSPPQRQPVLAVLLLKAVFAFVALGLLGSTCLGVYMALRQAHKRRLYLGLLAIGAVVPAILAALTA